MPEVLRSPEHLPIGSHGISLHASLAEAAENAAAFLAGAPEGQTAVFWVADTALQAYYQERVAEEAPSQVGCVLVLGTEQVGPVDGKLRPVEPIMNFIAAHPEGVTAAGGTISQYWDATNVREHLEYEAWFDEQPRDGSRFLCPYDLRTVPPEDVPGTLRELGKHHSHVILSPSTEPAVRLLQLFLFRTPEELPAELLPTLRWAMGEGLVESLGPSSEMTLTEAGDRVVVAWSRRATVD